MNVSNVPSRKVSLWQAYRLRLKRRQLLWRAIRSRRSLQPLSLRTERISTNSILAVCTIRNEVTRLPYFLKHYRGLGVDHFLIIDNASDDGSAELLAKQDDVSVWRTDQSYRDSRFGLDWMTWLQMRYARSHWCLMVDADELLVYENDDRADLHTLTAWLDAQGHQVFGALMLDLYPKGELGTQAYCAGQDPREVLEWFDAGPYRAERQSPKQNLWVQGGARERVFFADAPERSPTLNKIPLVKWKFQYAYVNSCHSILPGRLNLGYDGPSGKRPSGALLHTKFLPEIVAKSEAEKGRQQHFNQPEEFDHYYDEIGRTPNLWHKDALRYTGPSQLEELGLIRTGDW